MESLKKILKVKTLFLLITLPAISFANGIYVYCPPASALSCNKEKCELAAKYAYDWKIEEVVKSGNQFEFSGAGVDKDKSYAGCHYNIAGEKAISLHSLHPLFAGHDLPGNKWQDWYGNWLCYYTDKISECPLISNE